MTQAIKIEQILLWLFVILAGIVIGAGLYEMRVTVPLWAESPPESVWYWEAQRIANPQYVPERGRTVLGLPVAATRAAGVGDFIRWLKDA